MPEKKKSAQASRTDFSSCCFFFARCSFISILSDLLHLIFMLRLLCVCASAKAVPRQD